MSKKRLLFSTLNDATIRISLKPKGSTMPKKKRLNQDARKEIEMYLNINMNTFREDPIPKEKMIAFTQDLYYLLREKKKMISLHHLTTQA